MGDDRWLSASPSSPIRRSSTDVVLCSLERLADPVGARAEDGATMDIRLARSVRWSQVRRLSLDLI